MCGLGEVITPQHLALNHAADKLAEAAGAPAPRVVAPLVARHFDFLDALAQGSVPGKGLTVPLPELGRVA